MSLKDKLLHQWLSVPYTLHAEIRSQPTSKHAPTVLFIHGIGNTGAAWDDVIAQLPVDMRLITIDLLGFGQSRRPAWALYNASTQARSIMATFLKLRLRSPVIIVGHSLGALVAVEIAKKYPLLVRSLILCSPPFYKVDDAKRKLLPSSDRMLREMFTIAKNHPERFMRLSQFAVRLGLVNKSFSLTPDNAPIYMNALEAAIINQTSLRDAKRLSVPIHILYGRLDPVVIVKNLRDLANVSKSITLTGVLAGHEVKGSVFVKATTKAIEQAIKR